MDRLNIGIVAHVDAGKTTLAEAILYITGALRSVGRVDHGNAFLDNFAMERERGITIFSKQAEVKLNDLEITLLDTPGHVDFSAEMERTLQVLDAAILVISASDGVQSHTETLWRLLRRYDIPVYIFVNKMDQPGNEKEKLMATLQKRFGTSVVDMEDEESVASGDEELLASYLDEGSLDSEAIAEAVMERRIFPAFFGSALKLEGVDELLAGIERYHLCPEYEEAFGARIFKIARDDNGRRLTYLKVTGGRLKAKQLIDEAKIDQIRIYNGSKFETVDELTAGRIGAVTGLETTCVGQGLGAEEDVTVPVLEPVLSYRIQMLDDTDQVIAVQKLRTLEEEIPELHVVYNELNKEIMIQVMGEVQTEILKRILRERFQMEVAFTEGSICYKETIAEPAIGIGHFEPLRHYAEVHLLLLPGDRGSGMQFEAEVSEDELKLNWQRLIMTHLEERHHRGVLTGAELTDMKIVLVAGRAHLKHTEGGDFRQATYRAVRQGLMGAKSVLLEPVYEFRITVPTENVGRVMSDMGLRNARPNAPELAGEGFSLVTGIGPVSTLQGYAKELKAYTGGRGSIELTPAGFEPCHDAEEVIVAKGYDPDSDLRNPSASVFCEHGAGTNIDWTEVPSRAHVPSDLYAKTVRAYIGDAHYFDDIFGEAQSEISYAPKAFMTEPGERFISVEEVDAIIARGQANKGKPKRRFKSYTKKVNFGLSASKAQSVKPTSLNNGKAEEYFLVDGYNIIFAWEELRELSKVNIDAARDKLCDILCNFQGYRGCTLIVVFDAYKVKGGQGSISKYHNIHVVYTKEAETADQYIEKTVHTMAKQYRVTVATSDRLEQMIIWGSGATRISAREFKTLVDTAGEGFLK